MTNSSLYQHPDNQTFPQPARCKTGGIFLSKLEVIPYPLSAFQHRNRQAQRRSLCRRCLCLSQRLKTLLRLRKSNDGLLPQAGCRPRRTASTGACAAGVFFQSCALELCGEKRKAVEQPACPPHHHGLAQRAVP